MQSKNPVHDGDTRELRSGQPHLVYLLLMVRFNSECQCAIGKLIYDFLEAMQMMHNYFCIL